MPSPASNDHIPSNPDALAQRSQRAPRPSGADQAASCYDCAPVRGSLYCAGSYCDALVMSSHVCACVMYAWRLGEGWRQFQDVLRLTLSSLSMT
mmetsp:Transcript_46692/g.122626  ORF Transcript_46692/g.122626 Transcript_46692/m.122626 type:complete len:94 (-) Transcript_46692:240-521(-)